MLLLLVLSFQVQILVCVFVHSCQHFKCRSSQKNEESGLCHTKHFKHFFPVLFALYMLLMLILSSFITLKYILNDAFIDTHPSLPFTHWRTLTSIRMSTSYIYIDYAVYALMILAMISESFFHFYRYYTIKSTAFYFYSPTVIDVLKPFSLYMSIIIIFFLLQTQLYYYLFPIVVLSFGIAQFYCILQTSRIVIRFGSAELLEVKKRPDATQRMQSSFIDNVLFMRDLSVICAICSCLYLSAFMIFYNMNIVYLFPFIWSVSITCFVLQFIRNRRYLSKHMCCRSVPSQQGVVAEGSLFICVENIDKDKPIADQPVLIRTKPEPSSVGATSLPITDFEPKLITYNKFHSTGDLLSLLQKTKRTVVARDREKQLPLVDNDTITATATAAFTSLSAPIPGVSVSADDDDCMVYCDDTGRYPPIELRVIDSGQATALNLDAIKCKITEKRSTNSKIRDQKIGSLHISITQAEVGDDVDERDSRISRRNNTLTITKLKNHNTRSFTPSVNDKLSRTQSKPTLLDNISDATCATSYYSDQPTPFDHCTLAAFNNTPLAERTDSKMSINATPVMDDTPNPHNLNVQFERHAQPSVSSVLQLFVAQGFSDITND
eukprot:69740_1